MPFVPVDINSIKLDAPQSTGLVPVDINAIQMDDQQGGETSLSDKLSDNYSRRIGQMDVIADQVASGQINKTEGLGRMGLKFAQQLPDAAGSVMVEGFESLPDAVQGAIKEGASDAVGYLANTDLGRATSSAVTKASNEYKDFALENPVAAGRIESVLDVGNLGLPFIRVGGKSAINAVEDAAGTLKKGGDAAMRGTGNAASRMLPSVDDGLSETAQLAQKFNIPLSFDQISSSPALANIQKVSQELPFSGQSGFKAKQMHRWQQEVFKTFGVDADKFTPKTMKKAFDKVGGEFDSITKGKQFQIGGSFVDDLANMADEMPSIYSSDAAKTFEREAIRVINSFSGDSIPGEVIARQRSRINALARKAKGEQKYALQDLENALISGITSNDPALKSALSTAKHRYKNLIAVEPLAAKAKGGMISPTQLNNRVSRIYGRAHTVGESGDIGDLARIGHELMATKGGSDTTQKLMYAGGALGGAVANVPITAAALGGNRLMQSAVNRNQNLVRRAIQMRDKKAAIGQAKSPSLLSDESGSVNPKAPIAPALGAGAIGAGAYDGGEYRAITMPPPPQASAEPPPDNLLNRIAMAESSGNPNAQAPTSSASGLFQFTDPTWKSVVKKYGRKHGIKLGNKSNPDAQRIMAQELADEHRKALKPILGREPNDGEIYLAHFAGSGGAKRLLKAPSQAPAAKLLPQAAKANRQVFYDGRRMRTAGEVIQLLSGKV